MGAKLSAATIETPAGGGTFALSSVTLGVFLVDQPEHRIALGGDRRKTVPLRAREGWVMPKGAEGFCAYDASHRFVTVAIPDRLWAEGGGPAPSGFAPRIGALDPLLVELALKAQTLDAGGALYAATMSLALTAHLAGTVAPGPADAVHLDDHRLRRARSLIEDRLGEDLSMEALAAEAGLSPFHFARAFRAATGESPLQFVIRRRIETARLMLRSTALPVAEIAFRVGYGDVSRFGQHFKRLTGLTPAAFRRT